MSKEKFLQLAKQFELKRKELDAISEEMVSTMKELGLDTYAQDPEQGLYTRYISQKVLLFNIER